MDSISLYFDYLQDKFNTVENQLDVIVSAASKTADKIISGGKLYGYGDEEGFEAELGSRAGGLMGIEGYDESKDAVDGDVIIAATQDRDVSTQKMRLETAGKNGVYIILIGSKESELRPYADVFIDTGLGIGTSPIVPFKGSLACPVAGVIDITAMWVFVLEYTSACIRRGKMPVFWKSVCVPAGMGWINKYSGQIFHESGEFDIPPVPEKDLGRAYLANLHRCLGGLRSTEMSKIRETGKLAAAAIKNGGTVYCDAIGHHMHSQRGIEGDPAIIKLGFPESSEEAGPFKKDDYFITDIIFILRSS